MAVATMTVTDFLLARIAEDEAEIGARIFGHDDNAGPNGMGWAEVGAASDVLLIKHARALAECEAKRAIVDQLQRHERLVVANAEKGAEASRSGLMNQEQITALRTHGWELSGRREALRMAVDALAAVYSDHPDYRADWRA